MNCRIKISSGLCLFLILLVLSVSSCRRSGSRFNAVSSGHSNIHFNNQITENDSINLLDNENVYNGGGVGIGDFDNDGLPDIFFTGNQVSCRLYLNKGNFEFRDVTEEANVGGMGKWCRGVSVIDINNDGWMDIYVCATMKKNPSYRKNMLYINQGLNGHKIPVFREEAAEYGLDDNSHTTQADFFDYDNDGDLDVYLVVNEINNRISPYLFRPVLKNGYNPSTGKLLRNDPDTSLKHPVFTDVSARAGIQKEGYSHSAIITDINKDGWKDIYVGNDFLSNDLMWINNKDGTFTDELGKYFRHTSSNCMGTDVGDINNDGLMDVVSLDMNPQDNYRRKMMLPASSYQTYQNIARFGYNYQYIRNTLQLNQGPSPDSADNGRPVFSEIGYYAGISATDWSWTPMLTDFDNDGYKDLIVCNGFPRDITDHDFGMYRIKAYYTASKSEILRQVPEVKLHNYAFRNNADLTFSEVSSEWGMNIPTFSSGAAYADLDMDGDEDIIINNINDEASVYRNNSREKYPENSHYLRVKLEGGSGNISGFGAWVELYYNNGKKQFWENSPYRGYLSSIEDVAHFGLGEITQIDSVVVKWPDGKKQLLRNPAADQLLTFKIADAKENYSWNSGHEPRKAPLFKNVTSSLRISYKHDEIDFTDFNIQKLIPHKFSESGPSLAAGDIDGNGLDDLVSGGSAGNNAILFLQQQDGKFISRQLPGYEGKKTWDDAGLLLFDADSDGDPDLYIASGGYEHESNSAPYQDHLYVNNGKGMFKEAVNALPENHISKSCVRTADFDKDGDPDIFVAGRVDPWNYPKPVSCTILRNDTKNGVIRFTDITGDAAKDLINIGLVSDAMFTDFDNDGWVDLILAGEWMPLTFLKNDKGTFKNVTAATGIMNYTGWWNSLSKGDFDNDGDMDYIAGNMGLNSFYKASPKYPVSIYAADFDNNGSFDAFPAVCAETSQSDTTVREYPVHGRDDAIKQMISMRSRFQNYKTYAAASIQELFSADQLKNALALKANCMESCYIRNDGNGKFSIMPLPVQAQLSVINGMVADDFDNDGNLDVLINGNDYGTDVFIGRYDALNGLLLKGDGMGNFVSVSLSESGVLIQGNGKALTKLRGADNRYLVAAGQNRGPLKIFELNKTATLIPLEDGDEYAELTLKNGTKRKAEFQGSSFLSQSASFIEVNENMKQIVVFDNSGTGKIKYPK